MACDWHVSQRRSRTSSWTINRDHLSRKPHKMPHILIPLIKRQMRNFNSHPFNFNRWTNCSCCLPHLLFLLLPITERSTVVDRTFNCDSQSTSPSPNLVRNQRPFVSFPGEDEKEVGEESPLKGPHGRRSVFVQQMLGSTATAAAFTPFILASHLNRDLAGFRVVVSFSKDATPYLLCTQKLFLPEDHNYK